MGKDSDFAVNRRVFTALMAAAAATPFMPGLADAQDQPAPEQVDRTIRVAVGDFSSDSLDPSIEKSRAVTLNQLVQMYDTLLEIGPNSELIGGVAETWSVDESGLVWTFNLRKGIQFHDDWGELTAADVAFSFNRFMNEKTLSSGGSVLRTIIDHVEEVDPYTVKVYVKQASMNLPYVLSPHQQEPGIVLCKRYLVEKAGDDFAAQSKLLEEKPIGSGPFKFVSRELGNSYTFEAVPKHWRNTPSFKGLEIILVPEPATQLAMLQTGDIDIISIIGDQVKEVKSAGLEVHTVPGALNIWYNVVGHYRPPAQGKPTTDVRVRRALSLAINRQQILDTVIAGYGSLPVTPLNTITVTADINKDDYREWAAELARYDPEEARKLLAEAGYPEGFSDIQLFNYTRPGTPFLPQLAEIIAAQWAEIGVQVTLVPIDYGAWIKHASRADINDDFNAGDIATHSSGARFDALGPIINMWLHKNGAQQLLNDPQLDADIARAITIVDDEERRALVRDINNRVNETWLAPPLFDIDALFAVNPQAVTGLTGFPGSPYLGRVFETLKVA